VGSPTTPGKAFAASACASGSQALSRPRARSAKGFAAGELVQFGELLGAEIPLQASDPACQRGQRIRIGAALRHVVEQLLQRRRGLAVEGLRIGLVLLADTHRIHDDETVLHAGAWRHSAQLVRRDHPHAAPLHLLEEAGRFDVAHEEHAFDRLHVGTGRDHVHRDRDARIEAVAKIGEDFIRAKA
jgi:hypothetical protein